MAGEHPRRLELPPGGLAWDETLELRAVDGTRLRGALWRPNGAGRGVVLMLQGRTEFLEKYTVPAAALTARGFAAASLDWRGQGHAARLLANPLKGHVERFTDYHLDLAALLEHPLVARLAGRRLVLAHSMGATIALGAVLRGRLRPAALILSAPMLGIALTPFQRLLAGLLVPLARACRRSKAWPPVTDAAVPNVFLGFEDNLLTADRAQFDWMVTALKRAPDLRLAMPTLGWIGAARDEMAWLAQRGPVGVPGLCLLGSAEGVVDPAAVRGGAARLGLELVEIGGARHELLIAAEPGRSQVWAAIDRFLAAQAL